MRLYAETNFILEAVLEQEESAQVEVLSEMAHKGELDLVLPAASLFEAYGTVHRRRAERADLVQRLDKELMQIERSLAMAKQASQVRGTLVSASAMVTERFKQVRSRLLRAVRWIAMDHQVLTESCQLEDRHDLQTPDAVMLASVLVDARQRGGPSVFVTKNTHDFDDPDITSALAAVGCEVSFKIAAALHRVRSSS